MSATARRRGTRKRWEVPAAPAIPDVVKPAKSKKAAPPTQTPAPNADPNEGGIEAVKRRLNRLALDVHDGPMQNLAVIGFSLGDLRRKMHALVPADQHDGIDAGMAQIGAELGRVESELRALIGALEHGAVTSVPVVDAIEMEIAEFSRRSAVVPELIVEGDVRHRDRLAADRSPVGHPRRARERREARGREDGEDPAHRHGRHDHPRDRGRRPRLPRRRPPKQGRFGLTGMRERVEMLGGTFDIQSRPGGPTKVTATLETWRPPAAA